MLYRAPWGGLIALMLVGVAGYHSVARAMPRCSFESISGMSFGAYSVTRAEPEDSVAFIAFSCDDMNGAQAVLVQLSRGGQNSFIPRYLSGPGSHMEYNLYLDAARTLVWGDGTAGTSQFRARPTTGETVTVPVYGRIAPHQSVRSGVYSDVVVVTLVF